MSDFYDDLELIRNFLADTMTDGDKEQLRARLNSDSEFKKLFEEQKLIREAVLRKEREEIWKKIGAVKQQVPDTGSTSSGRMVYWVTGIAATIVLVMILFWLPSGTPEEFTAYYKPFNQLDYPKPRGSNEIDIALSEAAVNYKKGEYSNAVDILRDVDANDDVLFVRGLSLMGEKKYDEAIDAFEKIPGNFVNANAAVWYESLCYVALNKKEKALEVLKKLGDDSGFPVEELRKSL